jgi:large subunit ribosomal protein L13
MNDKKYYVIDAKAKPLGRISTKVASLLMGKNDPNFAPNVVPNNIVVVINAKDVYLTGTKELSKRYFHHSGFHGGIKEKSFSELKKNNPTEIIIKAVRGMIPRNRLAKDTLKNLKIFVDGTHPFSKENIVEIKE